MLHRCDILEKCDITMMIVSTHE